MQLSDFVCWLGNFPRVKSEDTQDRILKLLKNVGQACGLGIEDLLAGVDFDPKNRTEEKLESIISELRAIMFLHETGFKNIRPVTRNAKQQKADMSGDFSNRKLAIEVACLTSVHSREKEDGINAYRLDKEKFLSTLQSIAENKKSQLDADALAPGKLLVFVVNRSPERELYGHLDYSQILDQLNTSLNWGNEYFLQ